MTDSKLNTSVVDDDGAQIVKLVKLPIELYKILKFEGLVGSGGEAKVVIDKGLVILNTVVETQSERRFVRVIQLNLMGLAIVCSATCRWARRNQLIFLKIKIEIEIMSRVMSSLLLRLL